MNTKSQTTYLPVWLLLPLSVVFTGCAADLGLKMPGNIFKREQLVGTTVAEPIQDVDADTALARYGAEDSSPANRSLIGGGLLSKRPAGRSCSSGSS